MSEPTFIVVESGSPEAFESACADLGASARKDRLAFDRARPGKVCAGEVADEQSAQQAVLAALARSNLVVAASAPREVIDMLCDDLRRLGKLDHRVGDQARSAAELGHTERALLERLLAGDSLGEAAAALHLSRRTADRRLAAARRALGAATTAEALALAVKAGLRPPPKAEPPRP